MYDGIPNRRQPLDIMLQPFTRVWLSALMNPIFSSRVNSETRLATRLAMGSDASQKGWCALMLPGWQPHACPFGKVDPSDHDECEKDVSKY
jgi:hypothetical protein